MYFVYFRDDTIITPEYHWYVYLCLSPVFCLQCELSKAESTV